MLAQRPPRPSSRHIMLAATAASLASMMAALTCLAALGVSSTLRVPGSRGPLVAQDRGGHAYMREWARDPGAHPAGAREHSSHSG